MKKLITVTILFALFQSCNRAVFDIKQNFNIGALPKLAPSPFDNPSSPDKIELGKLLFFDPILSSNNKVSCASCHAPSKGFTDGLGRSNGLVDGLKTKRNAPTILNSAFNGMDNLGSIDPGFSPQFYDNRALSLEEQCLGPLLSSVEMKGVALSDEEYLDSLEREVTHIKEYRNLFFRAFADSLVSIENINKAIASYERTLITPNSPFDRYMRGEAGAMTEKQIEGMQEFIKTGCNQCHSGPMFSDYKLHVLGVEETSGLASYDKGDGRYAFRTTTLRNLAFTAPYMHNGSQSTLEEVMKFYQRKRSRHPEVPNKDLAQQFKDLKLNPLQRSRTKKIIAFLEALNDPDFDQSAPERVPSGLFTQE